MASYKALIFLVVALFAVAFAAEEARDKRGVFYGGYGQAALPYSAGYSALPYSAGYSAGYSALPYSAGYGLGYTGYNGYSGYGAYPYAGYAAHGAAYPYGAISYAH